MSRPLLRAEAIIVHADGKSVLVQCDNEESFYRFPGGSIEFGETAAEAIRRELLEEFDLPCEIGVLACVNESIVEYDGHKRHDCTLLHWCSIDSSRIGEFLVHNERPEIKLVWRTFDQLEIKPLYPEGIYDFLLQQKEPIFHIVVRKNYDK